MGLFDRLLKPKTLNKITQGLEHAELLALDNYLLQASKGKTPGTKLVDSYAKLRNVPTQIANPKGNLAPAALAIFGGTTLGGIASKPLALSLVNTAKRIDPVLAKSTLLNTNIGLNPVLSLAKPAAAVTTAPFSYAAKGLDALTGSGLAGVMAAHPFLSGFGAVAASSYLAPKIARGTSKLFSRLGRRRRLNLLQQGIAPKAYRAVAKQHGFK